MGMTEDDKRSCCLLEIQETEAKYYRTLEDIEKVGRLSAGPRGGVWCPGCVNIRLGVRAATLGSRT